MNDSVATPVIWIGIATRQRPDRLANLLASISKLSPSPCPVRVVVVDNDRVPSARDVVARFGSLDVHYVHEPRAGIPIARNRALAVAGDGDLLAFIDDDEVAEKNWLKALHAALVRHDADAVVGPVVTVPPPGMQHWVLASGFFDSETHPEGSRLTTGATNNALVKVSSLRSRGLTFDEDFPLLGGTDSWLFSQLAERGGDIRWTEDAKVFEGIPASRVRSQWLLRRAFRAGYAPSRRRLRSHRGLRTLAIELSRSAYRTIDGLRLLCLSPLRGRSAALRGGQRVAAALGTLWAISGGRFREYRTPD